MLYNAVVHLGWFLFRLVAPWRPKWKAAAKGRVGLSERLKSLPPSAKKRLWVHCASVGEFEDVRTALGLFVEARWSLVITFQSPSGIGKVQQFPGAEFIDYIMPDTPRSAQLFVECVRPDAALFSRSELWLSHLRELKDRRIPTFLLGFRATSGNRYFSPLARWFYRECFRCFTQVFCDDQPTASQLKTHYPTLKTAVVGNPRFDRVGGLSTAPALTQSHWFRRPFAVIGSMDAEDFEHLCAVVARFTSLTWVVAPHEVDQTTLAAVEKLLPSGTIRFSNLLPESQAPVVLIDSVGQLSRLYNGATLAIVGGGFSPKGIHSVLEPLAHAVPTACGPKTRGYAEVNALRAAGLLHIYAQHNELSRWIEIQLKADQRAFKSEINHFYSTQLGASARAFQHIKEHLNSLQS